MQLGLTQKPPGFRVLVCVRPMFGREIEGGDHSIVTVDRAKASVQITNPDNSTHSFVYDAAFDHTTTLRDMYDQEVAMVVADVLNGKLEVWLRLSTFAPTLLFLCTVCVSVSLL